MYRDHLAPPCFFTWEKKGEKLNIVQVFSYGLKLIFSWTLHFEELKRRALVAMLLIGLMDASSHFPRRVMGKD